ncbi:MAG: Mu-like prophage major head subunit gpT family protein [Sedimentisphaerales bacterium]|nr:Mu-like prophage major head subunit gpT family protein [Sedimentisphaerales bacterium]
MSTLNQVATLGHREVETYMVALQAAMKRSWVSRLALEVESDQEYEDYGWLTATPALREWAGPRIAKAFTANKIRIENKTFEGTLKFKSDNVRRDKTGMIDTRVRDLAIRTVGHWQKLLSLLILNGVNATFGNGYDGKTFFDDDHEEGKSGVQKNLLTASEVSKLEVTTEDDPTPLEAAQAVLGMIAYMLTITDDEAEFINDLAQDFLVMTGPSLGPAFSTACTSRTLEGDVDNPLAGQKNYRVSHVINPYLTSWTTQFAVFRTDGMVKPLILQKEYGPEIQVIGAGSEHEIKCNEQLFGVKLIGNVGYGLWQYGAHATLS